MSWPVLKTGLQRVRPEPGIVLVLLAGLSAACGKARLAANAVVNAGMTACDQR